MLPHIASTLLLALGASARLDATTHRELLLSGRPQVGLWKALTAELAKTDAASQVAFAAPTHPTHRAYCFDQPVSHFDKSANGTFCHRYWIDASHYKPSGPVYLLDGGETSGEDRLGFLDTGILEILSNATDGLSIVLEHRYYGESVPVPSFSTDDLRFLNNKEALKDSAYFIEHFKPPHDVLNLSHPDALHPNNTPWIYYGGSYAGARAAHMRVEYPHLVWGAIASSAVTHAQINFPEYFEPIQEYADESCISALQWAVQTIDSLLDKSAPVKFALKAMFGLAGLEDDDFADVIQSPFGYWQAQNWDPAVGSNGWDEFCAAITSGKAGSNIGLIKVPAAVVNYATYVRRNIASRCPTDVADCFDSHDDAKFQDTDLSQTWRLWLFQVCTQWGYFMPAPPEGRPAIVSRRVTLDYSAKICKQAYPPGKHFSVPDWPDVDEVNRRGDYAIEADRLAFIDGDRDPWRPMSEVAPKRKSSVNKPVHLIYDAIHHYDENGLRNHSAEPARIRDVHEFEVLFVQEWLAQWKEKEAAETQA